MNLAFGQHKQCVALPLVPAIARAAPPGHHHDHDDHTVTSTMRLLIISLSLLGLGRTFLATLSQALRIKLPPPPRVR